MKFVQDKQSELKTFIQDGGNIDRDIAEDMIVQQSIRVIAKIGALEKEIEKL